MLLAEHNSKELIAQYGVPIPEGHVAGTAEEAKERARSIDAGRYVVKAQISAGGRGLAGGIRFAATPSAVAHEAERLLGSRLVTEQTGPAGATVDSRSRWRDHCVGTSRSARRSASGSIARSWPAADG